MSVDSPDRLACCDAPDNDFRAFIGRTFVGNACRRDDLSAVAAEDQAAGPLLVALECGDFLAQFHIPEFDGTVQTGRGQTPAIGTERHGNRAIQMAFERVPLPAGL